MSRIVAVVVLPFFNNEMYICGPLITVNTNIARIKPFCEDNRII